MIQFTAEENAALLALGEVHRAEMAAQQQRLLMDTQTADASTAIGALLRARFRETVLRIRLRHGCPEDQFNLVGDASAGYGFMPIEEGGQ
ncbi:MAG: hypothetical protein HY231_18280 [Acidobacteria bacterium]|nr:hypothetical protein [Acidobacteriota bacterium]